MLSRHPAATWRAYLRRLLDRRKIRRQTLRLPRGRARARQAFGLFAAARLRLGAAGRLVKGSGQRNQNERRWRHERRRGAGEQNGRFSSGIAISSRRAKRHAYVWRCRRPLMWRKEGKKGRRAIIETLERIIRRRHTLYGSKSSGGVAAG
jgi:hypothetical protein